MNGARSLTKDDVTESAAGSGLGKVVSLYEIFSIDQSIQFVQRTFVFRSWGALEVVANRRCTGDSRAGTNLDARGRRRAARRIADMIYGYQENCQSQTTKKIASMTDRISELPGEIEKGDIGIGES